MLRVVGCPSDDARRRWERRLDPAPWAEILSRRSGSRAAARNHRRAGGPHGRGTAAALSTEGLRPKALPDCGASQAMPISALAPRPRLAGPDNSLTSGDGG